MSKSRFLVGETYLFFTNRLRYIHNEHEVLYYGTLGDAQLIDTIIIELTCLSEHAVPIEYQNDKKAKGYIFSDKEGNHFHNQYPSASYGQVSDIGDRVAHTTDGLYNNYMLVTNLLDDINRSKRVNGEELLDDDVKQIVKRIEQYMTSNNFQAEQVAIWDIAPEITKTVIKKV